MPQHIKETKPTQQHLAPWLAEGPKQGKEGNEQTKMAIYSGHSK